jgi:hypothetical protein
MIVGIQRIAYISLSLILAAPSANAVIVNINSDLNDLLNPVNVFLDAGTYTVTNVGVADGGAFDGWTNWSFTTCADASGCPVTSPTSLTGWRSSYNVISPDLTDVKVAGTSLPVLTAIPGFPGIFEDYFAVTPATTRYHVDDMLVYPTALAALTNARGSMFTLTSSGFVGFAINDIRPLADNRGGVSLEILAKTPEPVPVPEPTTLSLLGASLLGFGLTRRRIRVA